MRLQLRRILLGRLGLCLLGQIRKNQIVDFIDGLQVRRLFFFHLQNVKAKLRANHRRQLTRLQRKSGLIECRHGSAMLDESEFPALRFAAWIVRILFREVGEIAARLQLLQNVLLPSPWLPQRSAHWLWSEL